MEARPQQPQPQQQQPQQQQTNWKRKLAVSVLTLCGASYTFTFYPKLFYFGAGVLGLGLLALFKYQSRLLYFPDFPVGSRTCYLDPAVFKQKGAFEEIFVEAEDGVKLQCWFFKQPNPQSAPTLLYFHENAGNLSHRLDNIEDFYHKLQVNVFILSYRGYGKSGSHPTEEGIRLDARAALKYLIFREDINQNKIIIFGRSLGGGVAIQLCACLSRYGLDYLTKPYSSFSVNFPSVPSKGHVPPPRRAKGENEDNKKKEEEEESRPISLPAALIIENTFTSILDMVDEVFPYLSCVKFLSKNVYDSQTHIQHISCPVLLLAGKADELVPHYMMKTLFERIRHPRKKMIVFTKGYHMTVWQLRGYSDHITDFLCSYKLL
eukprot:CAMPEP_0201486580 /NCGR_PEP_ID=MMETSP0151_2-20130828/10641_1 /ASSEMBLY_ACC=CAM_ASM_000257 /TAXON_ID=200890 /ORGANISM="Paramoeba atlantica, Strain 621/1 / CCAP 1560/9" /LENGTH=376 /DNA_ID=CAMNT_0047871299 /DNA_START=56 /DNA_END=1186 /DNA_ORIENTATION=+